VDVLAEAARHASVSVTFSIPTLDEDVWRKTEPSTAHPRQRLRALKELVDTGIKVGVGMAPILPGISDRPEQLAEVVRAAREAGATGVWANLLFLRPGTREHFLEHLAEDWPELVPLYEELYARKAYLPAKHTKPVKAQVADLARRFEIADRRARPIRPEPRPEQLSLAVERGLGLAPHLGGAGQAPDNPQAAVEASPTPNSTPEREITCLIVDDHEVVREGLRLSLSRAPHIRVIGEASDGASAVSLAERRRPDVVIMDVRMPGMDGLQATKILSEKLPETAVLIFTAYSERSLLGRGLESGAKGYILKEAPHQTLLRAIEKVAAGDGYVDPALMPAFLSGKEKDDMLTGREREILQLLADGMSNADVAQRLFISQETVKSHVRHILAKLEADTRTHAVAIALRDAIID
ncbi:MAG TPA: response regulator, partial [Gaiellaceae bacterium]|nr:response regulator [Gaiellaceae bacterium]